MTRATDRASSTPKTKNSSERRYNASPMAKRSKATPSQTLKGWKGIGEYLGIGAAAAQRWATSGMPVRREGRFMVAEVEELRRWIGGQSHMAALAFIASSGADVSAALKESLTLARMRKHEQR